MLIRVTLILNFLLFSVKSCPFADRSCTTPNWIKGLCVPLQYCPEIDNLIKHSDNQKFIEQSLCGKDNEENALYCCDKNKLSLKECAENRTSALNQSTQLKLSGFSSQSQPIYCQTPNGDRAQCLSIFNCPSLLSIAKNTKNETERRFLRESKCGYEAGTFFVCCGNDVAFMNFQEDAEIFEINNLIPTETCGQDSLTIDNRIFGGIDSDVNEFPWTALLEYENIQTGQKAFFCGGSLISSQYVLTVAHCIIQRPPQKLVNVRLGEWNFNNQGNTCLQTSKGPSCMNAPINVAIESLHLHPFYQVGLSEKYHDIGLIRLKNSVQFTDNIKPVCLPNVNNSPLPGERLTISGWGLKNYNERSNIKQKVNVPVISISQCSIMFERNSRLFNLGFKLGRGQFCAGGESGKDACTGDSGSPLMRRLNSTGKWYIEGLVSFGIGCGATDHYGVYTKVSKYTSWIHKTIKS
ncbi:hypothetical protein ABEB36_005838 [Hypothenemus hampei]|uniref:CLIP domain-containing serine protease n=1 Tax=Hypothenemus hampei TaxID=57062 RepID=A0ABD1EZQ1_HYPHA